MIAYAKLLDVEGNVDYDGITIKCKLLENLRDEDIGKTVVIAYPQELEDSIILGVVK
jgi:hypothetical protein